MDLRASTRGALRESRLYPLWTGLREWREVRRWEAAGCPAPPPHAIKRKLIRGYATTGRFRTFVETGTYLGEMVEAMRDLFERVVTVEVEPALAARASERFRGRPNVQVLQGDSMSLLPAVLAEKKGPCLFWLDGHFSGGITGQGARETPIRAELLAILSDSEAGHVVLIDDARCFTGEGHYPTLAEVEDYVTRLRPEWKMILRDDIIRVGRPELL